MRVETLLMQTLKDTALFKSVSVSVSFSYLRLHLERKVTIYTELLQTRLQTLAMSRQQNHYLQTCNTKKEKI